MKKIVFLFFWLPVLPLPAQNIQIDSLKMILQSGQTAEETTKTLVELCWEYGFINADTAYQYGTKALELAQKSGFLDWSAGKSQIIFI